jgi:hypothetical protein
MNQRKALAHVDIFEVGGMGAFARWAAVRQIIGREEIGFRRIVQNVVAGVNAGVKVGIDEAGRNKTAFGVDLSVNRLGILFANELEAVVLKYNDTLFDDFVLFAIETDDETALNQCLHFCPFSTEIFRFSPLDVVRQGAMRIVKTAPDLSFFPRLKRYSAALR